MKKIKSIGIILLGISTLLLSACSSSPDNLKTIPVETNVVSVIDVYSIIKKGKLTEISELKFFKTLKKEIRSENKKVSKIINNIIEDPSLSGINFQTDVFAYYINEAQDEKFVCLSAEIKSEEKFSEFIENVLDKSNVEFDIEKENKYNYTIVGNKIAIGWDNEKVILLAAENYKSRKNLDLEIETLFELKEKGQITAKEEFNKFYNNKKDVSVWLSTNLFEDNSNFKNVEKKIDFDITDNYISAYLNFDKNNISLKTQFSLNSEIQKMMDKNNIWDNKFNSKLLSFFPKQNYATASISINPTSYYNTLEQDDNFKKIQSEFERKTEIELKDLFEEIKGNVVYSLFGFENIEFTYMAYGYGFNENEAVLLDEKHEISQAGYLSEEMKELLNQGKTIKTNNYRGKYCINIKNILDNGGTIETAIENNSKINWYEGGWDYGKYIETTTEEFLPLMGMAFDINDNKKIKKLIDNIPEGKINKRSNYYEFTVDNKYPAYFAFNESVCFITNDKKSIKAFKYGGHSTDNLKSSDIGSDISNSNFYTFLNLNYDKYPKELKKEVNGRQNDKENKMLKIWSKFSESMELKQVDKNSIEIIFNLKDCENNSLNTIITTIDDNYKNFIR